jgi:hypothetical protein
VASEDQWRQEVAIQLRDSAQAHQQTAVILERLKGQQDLHDQRIRALEGAPATGRDVLDTALKVVGVSLSGLGCLGVIVVAAFSTVMGIISPIVVYFLLH